MPACPDPVTFPALVRIGELTAQGWTDRAIADELEEYISKTARFGERLLTKDTVAAIRRSWFPREFAPGSGYGTIDTPSGELVEGKHQAAWPYELWQRMVEVKASQYHCWIEAAHSVFVCPDVGVGGDRDVGATWRGVMVARSLSPPKT